MKKFIITFLVTLSVQAFSSDLNRQCKALDKKLEGKYAVTAKYENGKTESMNIEIKKNYAENYTLIIFDLESNRTSASMTLSNGIFYGNETCVLTSGKLEMTLAGKNTFAAVLAGDIKFELTFIKQPR